MDKNQQPPEQIPPEQIPPDTSAEANQTEKSHSFVPTRTIYLIVVLVIITTGLIIFALRLHTSSVAPVAPTPTPKFLMAHTQLSLSPDTATPSSVDVKINTTSNTVSGVQIELAYDPTVIQNVQVKQGTFFPQAMPLINNIDKTNGRISYALVIPINTNGVKGTGTVAIITYTKVLGVNKNIVLTFLPKTKVTQLGILDSVLDTTTNLTISATGSN